MKISRKDSKPHKTLRTLKAKPIKSHPTKKIVIKSANIDKEMIPIVQWLNNFDSVMTKWCCQGEDGEEGVYNWDAPYVVFSCDDPLDLLTIVEKVGYSGIVEIRPPLGIRFLDYCIKFPYKNNLEDFVEGLKYEV